MISFQIKRQDRLADREQSFNVKVNFSVQIETTEFTANSILALID